MNTKPNILLLLADQHRSTDMGVAGNAEVRTPTFDRMAHEGVKVTQCVSSHPLCAPFRGCLQTGQPAEVNGGMWNEDDIRRDLPTMPGLFKQQGYQTAYFGKCHWHHGIENTRFTPPEWRLGWEYWKGWQNGHEDYDLPEFTEDGVRLHPHKGRYAPEVQVEQFLEWHAGRDPSPWIVQLNWGPPHNASFPEEELEKIRPRAMQISEELKLGLQEQHFQNSWWFVQSFPLHLITDVVPQRYLDLFDPDTLRVPDNVHPENHRLIQYQLREYYAQIASLDDLTSRILEELASRGDLDNTIVIYTSDHGDWIGSHRNPDQNCHGKGGAEPESVRVPFLATGPGLEGGKPLEMPMATLDLLPTFCGLAGFTAGEGFPGEDLSPVLTGQEPIRPRAVEMSLADHWRASFDGERIQIR